MSSIKVIDPKGVPVGEWEVPAHLLVPPGKGIQAVHDAVTAWRAGLRAGTASTKEKGEVAGSGRKPWRQKGTGRARAGYRRSPVWRGGGVVFGPKPRSYEKSLPKKTIRLAFRRILTDKIEAGEWAIVETIPGIEPKTRFGAALLKEWGIRGSALILLEAPNAAFVRAVRNLPGVRVSTALDVHFGEVIGADRVFATRAAMEALVKRLGGEKEKAR